MKFIFLILLLGLFSFLFFPKSTFAAGCVINDFSVTPLHAPLNTKFQVFGTLDSGCDRSHSWSVFINDYVDGSWIANLATPFDASSGIINNVLVTPNQIGIWNVYVNDNTANNIPLTGSASNSLDKSDNGYYYIQVEGDNNCTSSAVFNPSSPIAGSSFTISGAYSCPHSGTYWAKITDSSGSITSILSLPDHNGSYTLTATVSSPGTYNFQILNGYIPIGNYSFTVVNSTGGNPPPGNTGVGSADNLGPGPANIVHLQQLVQRMINISVYLAGFVLTIVLVWAGIKFLTSGGDAKTIQSAYDVMTWALLGLVFLAIAWLILMLIKTFTGVDVTQFCLGFNCA